MQTSGRQRSEKAMIIIPAVVLVFMVMVITGGPKQFIRLLNFELRELASLIGGVASAWF